MISSVNLLPLSTELRFLRARQFRFWLRMWMGSALIFGSIFVMLDHKRRLAAEQLLSIEAEVAEVRQAASDVQRLTEMTELHRKLVNDSQTLEQTDVPLAILQTIGQCCREAGDSILLSSYRVSEINTTAPTTNAQSAQLTIVTPRKQVQLSGQAHSDQCLGLIDNLRSSGAFTKVELLSAQTNSEQVGSRQTFQIVCEQ
ncbi:MAG: hypothetical protein KF752_13020 [Pirellulaceae bacterium]|nr:hypothetical protein [Pirellulaceae bacterium]